jgi:hypothetical protein
MVGMARSEEASADDAAPAAPLRASARAEQGF